MSVCGCNAIQIRQTDSSVKWADRWDHLKARFGINRSGCKVEPGLYSLGSPAPGSPVFVTANYKLSFDRLRQSLKGFDCYILVLNTFGVNVWCAAGKGTFGTDELIRQINETKLSEVVNHRKVILPQLGAPGVAAHIVTKQTKFRVEYGPVRAEDIPEYMKTWQAASEMRRVKFPLIERSVLIPVELKPVFIPMILAGGLFYLIGGLTASAAIIAAAIGGAALFPVLLPWLPTPNFSTKGFLLGGLIALPFIIARFTGMPDVELWQKSGWALTHLLIIPSITAFIALNFTGASTFTSKTGVEKEMYAYIPKMAWMFGSGLVLSITFTIIGYLGRS